MNQVEHLEELKKLTERQKQINDDYIYVRNNYYELIEDAKKQLKNLENVCENSEHPRAFEVYFKAVKDLADACDKFMKHQREKQIVDSETTMEILRYKEQHGESPTLETMTIIEPPKDEKYYGSTTELQKTLALQKN